MAAGLNEEAFARLLDWLDRDSEPAGEKYEDLRRMLVRFFEWRGAPFLEELTDETLDRVARRLAEGIDVQNMGAYCYRVAQLVLLEHSKASRRLHASLDPANVAANSDPTDEAAEKERRLTCLDRCLETLPAEARILILEYYRDGGIGRIETRKRLAKRLALEAEALANRAQRLRDKLERCVVECLRHGRTPSATER